MRLALPILIALVLLAGCDGTPGETATPQPASRYDPQRDAAADLESALAEAARTDRRVLILVGGEWCSWCRRLDALFEGNRELSALRDRHYVAVKINWSKENRNEEVLEQFPRIPGYPHMFVLASDGGLLHSQDTAELEAGDGHDRRKVADFLTRWAG